MSNASMSTTVTGIVLAGGRSSRFGSDKLALEIDGVTVLDRAIAAVSVVAAGVLVVGTGHTALPVRRIDDPEPFGGPLQAVEAALEAIHTDLAVIVAGDMPSLAPPVLQMLIETLIATSDIDATVLATRDAPSRRQPVPLATRVGPARIAAAGARTAGDRSLVRLLDRLDVVEVPSEQWLPLDPAGRTLFDIDVPGDIG
jgi:molybdopterin-guanine dinucleotide biosynthesis protein A